jgi:hypothetical protein
MNFSSNALRNVVQMGVALCVAMAAAATAQEQGSAKVLRLTGSARYNAGDNVWHDLKVGDIIKPGSVLQTASDSKMDLLLAGTENEAGKGTVAPSLLYRPDGEVTANVVRMYENTVLGLDKLTSLQTGADVVTDTQLDLRAGKIMGTVKKMSAASKYEVKYPNGVAGIRGTIYIIDANGVVIVLSGTVLVSWVKPDGSTGTQQVMAGYSFDPRTGQMTLLTTAQINEIEMTAMRLGVGVTIPPPPFWHSQMTNYVSPTIGAPAPPAPASGGGGSK